MPGGLLDDQALLERLPPGLVRRVPLDRLAQAVLEGDLRMPAELAPDLDVEQVAAVVAGLSGTIVFNDSGLPVSSSTRSAISSIDASTPEPTL